MKKLFHFKSKKHIYQENSQTPKYTIEMVQKNDALSGTLKDLVHETRYKGQK